MKEPIVLLKAIKSGYYSDDAKERQNSKGGFLMQAGATYKYDATPDWENGHGYYSCGTHIIMESDVDWSIFCKQSEYHAVIDRVREQMLAERITAA